jgi:hypothetical protein
VAPGGAGRDRLERLSVVNGATDTDVMVATTEALHAALTTLVDAITTSDVRGSFRHCGYAVH